MKKNAALTNKAAGQSTSQGLKFQRYYTKEGQSPFEQFSYELRTSVIRNTGGDAVFEMKNVEVPASWSQVATDILAQKYFRKAGVPLADGKTGSENSIRQVAHRLAHTWRVWGERYGYFASTADAQVFYDELLYMILDQRCAPNSPQWFNTGLYEVYGIDGPPQGHWFVDEDKAELQKSPSAYARPQPHACFILSVDDDLVGEGGIMDLWVREARIFKYGSGVGTNFSSVRGEGEPLSGGGTSSGLMSFLKVGDRAAGAIKSGGTTRRAAKMVVLDIDHPEIMDFIQWKVEEEKKVAALIAAGYSSDYEGEAYRTVSGQNSNNSVRIPQAFFDALERDANWSTKARTTGKAMKTYKASELWDTIARAAHACADPGLQYHTTINDWHTCPTDGEIRASNPCSEYMFLDDTACNLASLNLRKFMNDDTHRFDVAGFIHGTRLWTTVLEISVLMAHYPSREIAWKSYEFRTLGLGYANLGSLLMVEGIPYDSKKATAIAGAITALMTGVSYATSAEMAAVRGPFPGYARNREHMLRVMRNHRYAAYNATDAYEGLSVKPQGIDPSQCPKELLEAACNAWDQALQLGEKHGYRNAQTTVLAPTGTIGLLMDCDTTGVEPDFALVKFKKLSGGGYFKIINQSIPLALAHLGYSQSEADAIVAYTRGHLTLEGAPHLNPESLRAKGFNDADLARIEGQLGSAFELGFVFNVYTLGEDCLKRLGFSPAQYTKPDFNLLNELKFTKQQLDAANEYVCGTMTVEGAPYLKPEHLPVFDCANKCGTKGQRFIQPHGHIRMMAAAQPFISGAISKTVNLTHEATWEDIRECYRLSWSMGLKAISIYRDGSKLSQPLSTSSGSKDEAEAPMQPAELTPAEIVDKVRQLLAHKPDPIFAQQLRNLVGRRELPQKRRGFTQKAKVGGNTIFLRTGEYADGTLGEIFVDLHKEGATLRSLVNCFAIAVSIGLQYGVPLEEFVDKFAFSRFDPSGPVELHPNLKFASSIVDYIFRALAIDYLDRTDLAHVPPTVSKAASIAKQAASFAEADASTAAASVQPAEKAPAVSAGTNAEAHAYDSAQAHLGSMMGDAPSCTVCGHITVRNGTCYRCMNCGHSMGCS